MQVKTWLHRLTDESNLWFRAVKAEDERDFISATANYLDDGLIYIDRNLVRSALSSNCAANCLASIGAASYAKALYNVAGRLYLRNSELAMSESIRETMWSLQESIANFALAGDAKQADGLRRRYNSFATRTNPFSRPSKLESLPTQPNPPPIVKQLELPSILVEKIRKFTNASDRLLTARTGAFDPKKIAQSIDTKKESVLSEKSIAS